MGRRTSGRTLIGFAALLVLAAGPVSAKDSTPSKADPKADAAPVLRWAHSYADALAEARERGCVVFATFHGDG